VVDTRPASEFAAAHLPGTINIPLNRAFTTWAGWIVPYDTDFYLVVDDRCRHCLDEATRDLRLIGLDRVRGYGAADLASTREPREYATGRIGQIDAEDVARRLEAGLVDVIDVRSGAEWEAGHIPGARHIPLGDLPEAAKTLQGRCEVVV